MKIHNKICDYIVIVNDGLCKENIFMKVNKLEQEEYVMKKIELSSLKKGVVRRNAPRN